MLYYTGFGRCLGLCFITLALAGALAAPSAAFMAGQAFARMDTNNDGVIDKDEFARSFSQPRATV